MIHQPEHIFGVVAYGIMSLIALGIGLTQFKTTKPRQRLTRWLLLCVGVGQAFWAADEWHWATLLLPKTYQHGWLYAVGSVFMAVSIIAVIWVSLKARAEPGNADPQVPAQN